MVPTTSTSPLAGKTVYGGGSGCSIDYPKPSYQTSVPMGSCTMRGSVDVSAAADFSPGVYESQLCIHGQVCGGIAVYGGGGWNPSVGTSAATPFVTAVLVRMGLATNPNTYFYTNHASFQDVTSGNNDPSMTCNDVMCNAGVGWDGPTGWGVPQGYDLAVLGGATGVVQPTPPTCLAVEMDGGMPATDGGGPPPEDGGVATDAGMSGNDAGMMMSGNDAGILSGNDAGNFQDASVPRDGGSSNDAGPGGGDAGSFGPGAGSSGCSCKVVGGGGDGTSPLVPVGTLLAVGAIALRLRRDRRR